MITRKIKARHWVVFILLSVGLISSLVVLTLLLGEQHHVTVEEFRLVFFISILATVVFAALLSIGIIYFRRLRA